MSRSLRNLSPHVEAQRRAEQALAACLPDEWVESWVTEFRTLNAARHTRNDPMMSAAEFIKLQLEALIRIETSTKETV